MHELWNKLGDSDPEPEPQIITQSGHKKRVKYSEIYRPPSTLAVSIEP